MEAYSELTRRFARIAAIDSACGILGWDASVMMPAGAGEGRGEQLATLRGLAHELLVAPRTGELIAQAREEAASLDARQRANLAEIAREYAHASAVPGDLVEAATRASSRCELLWREAREKGEFGLVQASLTEVLGLQREVGQAKGAALGVDAYDALLDAYDPGLRDHLVEATFAQARRELPDLIGEALEAQARRPAPLPFEGTFPTPAQTAIGGRILNALGFDLSRGRFDVSLHPFCGGCANDVRITTRYDESDFKGALMGLLHEGGHALYEQGRPRDFLDQPAGQARGMSLHESQSLLMEKHVGLSPAFLGWLAGVAREAFGASGPAWTAENFFCAFARVERSLIRVDADEVTYPAHVFVRHALERAMIRGDLAVADLPGAFNEALEKALGVAPPDDARGCLQDIHWYCGLWGYFPSYVIGSMIAAQLFGAARAAIDGLDARLAAGDVTPLRAWLRTRVHERASLASADQIVRDATGEALDSRHFLSHLRTRYVD